MKCEEILQELKSLSDPDAVKGMARYGINPGHAYGVSIPTLRKIGRRAGTDPALAADLWASGIHEARILASMVENPKTVTREQMEGWVSDFNSWDLCDQCCNNLFAIKRGAVDRRNFVKKAVNWSLRQIGKRNPTLNEEAVGLAEEIRQIDSKSARWIAADALRELKSDAVRKRLHKQKA
ncbi:MAG: DNA alkylation repair protein [Deltaproteobacteria bacterium]